MNPVQGPIPACAGIGLKPQHYRDILRDKPRLGFFEVHVENYMGAGGPPHRYLGKIAERYPLSFHGVGLSLGSVERPDGNHLKRWRELIDRYQPSLISEHIAWSAYGRIAHHDLLPIPYTEESLEVLSRNIDIMQSTLGRRMLVENPSSYVSFHESYIRETDFIVEIVRRTGCGFLLDINNVYVSAHNNDFSAARWLAEIPSDIVEEIHLAGHSLVERDGVSLRIDDHGSLTAPDVWALYHQTIERIGPRPTLIERDTDIPPLPVLLAEAAIADELIQSYELADVAVG